MLLLILTIAVVLILLPRIIWMLTAALQPPPLTDKRAKRIAEAIWYRDK